MYIKTVGGGVTDIYLSELKGLAKLSGKDFEDMLWEVMSTLAKSISDGEAELKDTVDIVESNILVVEPTQNSVSPPHQVENPHFPKSFQYPYQSPIRQNVTPQMLSPDDLSPPEIQKIVVEHVVRSADKTPNAHSSLRQHAFLGKTISCSHETKETSSKERLLQETWKIKNLTLQPLKTYLEKGGRQQGPNPGIASAVGRMGT